MNPQMEFWIFLGTWLIALSLYVYWLLDILFMRAWRKRLAEKSDRLFSEGVRLRAEREELRRIRTHLELLQEDFAKLECEIAHMGGDCPLCGAL